MQKCLESLAAMTTEAMNESSGQMQKILRTEQGLIIALIGVVVLIVLLTLFLIIKPLIEAVDHVRSDRPIPDKGSSEFRFLARTYNRMYESNHESQEKLAYEASHDQLTGLYNRNAFESLRREADSSLDALLLFDVDKFKSVNDTYGHEVGDRVLINVAEVVRGMFRASDHLCRIGGDEFAVIMVASGRDMTSQIKSKIDRINAALSAPEDDLPPVSISAGLAFGGVGRDSMVIYKDADAALYSVKSSGGCGCAVAGE